MYRILLISFIHITDTERNITRKIRDSCYKKYRVHRCIGNIGITICTIATGTNILHDFIRQSKKYTRNVTRLDSYRLFQIVIYELTNHFTSYGIYHIASLYK